jgi:hypothetical protein
MAGRWTVVSDYDYINDVPVFTTVTRTCRRCGHQFELATVGEYVLHVLCDACWRIVQSVQDRKMNKAAQA